MLHRMIPAALLALGLGVTAAADETKTIEIDQDLPTDLVVYDLDAEQVTMQEHLGEQATVVYMLDDDHLYALGREAKAKQDDPHALTPAHAALAEAHERFAGEGVAFIVMIRHPLGRYTLPETKDEAKLAAAMERQRADRYAHLSAQVLACKAFDDFTVFVDEGGALAERLKADPQTPAIVMADAEQKLRFANVEGEADGQFDDLVPTIATVIDEQQAKAKRAEQADE